MRVTAGVFLALLGSVLAKKRQKSEFVELTEVQSLWHRLWGEAAPGVSHACKEVNEFIKGTGCDWEKMVKMEEDIKAKSLDLLKRKPEFEAALAEMLKTTPALEAKLAAAEGAPQAVAAAAQAASDKIPCNAMTCKTRDDFCFCARSQGQMWEFDCAYGNSSKVQEQSCRKFLSGVCSVEFPEDEELEDFEGLDELEKKQKEKRKAKGVVEDAPADEGTESDSAFHKKMLDMKATLKSLDEERKALGEARGNTKDGKSGGRVLRNLDARLEKEKEKIVKQMEQLVADHEKHVELRKAEAKAKRDKEEARKFREHLNLHKDMNGEQACEGQGYNQHTCEMIGCCEYADGVCSSNVGRGKCFKDVSLIEGEASPEPQQVPAKDQPKTAQPEVQV